MSPETALWIDGAQLVEWLEGKHLLEEERIAVLGPRWERAIRAWKREGRKAQVYTVDEFLCSIGVCLGEMPDEFYCEAPKGGHAPGESENRDRILGLHRLGWTFKEIACIVGVNPDTVRKYVRQAEAMAA